VMVLTCPLKLVCANKFIGIRKTTAKINFTKIDFTVLFFKR